MKQEDMNEIISDHPGPELIAQIEELKQEAIYRDCACLDSVGFYDRECAWDNHSRPRKIIITK